MRYYLSTEDGFMFELKPGNRLVFGDGDLTIDANADREHLANYLALVEWGKFPNRGIADKFPKTLGNIPIVEITRLGFANGNFEAIVFDAGEM